MVDHTPSRASRESASAQRTSSLADAMGALQPHRIDDLGTAPWYRREPWLAVCIASFLPVAAALLAPQAWRVALTGVTLVMMAVSMLMLVMHLRKLRVVAARERQTDVQSAR